MVKNHDHVSVDGLRQIQEEFPEHNPNIILASNTFHKAELVNLLLNSTTHPVLFLDFDLLYSGYVTSGLVQKGDNVQIFRTSKKDWSKTLHSILEKTSRERFTVIIDSFNGFHSMYGNRESARFLNASLMLLSYVASFRRCSIVVLALARKNSQDRWILSPGGRHITGSRNSSLYRLKKTGDEMSIIHVTQ